MEINITPAVKLTKNNRWYNGDNAPDPNLGKDSDYYLDDKSSDYYKKTADGWIKAGNLKGERGEKGDQGEPGEDGADGNDGKDGQDGKDGEQGEKGKKGDKGDRGLKGEKGDRGPRGEKGKDGAGGGRGGDGAPGPQGPAGPLGPTGPQGVPGPKGDQGDPLVHASEDPTDAQDGVNTTYTTLFNYVSGSTRVYLNGLRQRTGSGNDYTETSANTIDFEFAPLAFDIIRIDYIKA